MGSLSKRFPRYSKLLQFYPAQYRYKYNEQMLQTLADMLDDPDKSHLAVWIITILDLPLSIGYQQLKYAGEIMSKETPNYIKQSSIFGAALLLPFFIFIFLDAVSSHSLYGTWFWHPWVAATWLIFMPSLAAIISLCTILYWLEQRRKKLHVSPAKSLLDINRSWPMVTVSILAIGIVCLAFFHDSVHCVAQNPVKDLKYWHTTWRCIQNG